MTTPDPDMPTDRIEEGAMVRLEAAERQLRETRVQLAQALGALDAAAGEVRAGQARERALQGELQHRVRNILGVVRSIFGRTVAGRDTLEDAASHFTGRLDALARNHASGFGWRRSADVEDMVRDELLEARADADIRVSIDGPPASLDGKVAESFGIAIHELVTNSIKFGILSHAKRDSRLRIMWEASATRLHFSWRETGVAVVSAAPMRIGFGREFIEQSLPYQADAATSYEIGPGSITCIIDLPLAARDDEHAEGEETFGR